MVDVSDDPSVCCAPKYLYSESQNASTQEPAVCSPPVARGDQAANTLATPAHDKFPDLPRTKASKGGEYFIESKGYQASIDGNVTYVKGWMTWIIELGDTVPASTGGNIGINWGAKAADKISGSTWRFAKDDTSSATGKKYWDGKAWQDVPDKWADPIATQLLGMAMWKDESGNPQIQYGTLAYPEKLPDWGATENALAAKTLPVWKSTIETIWTGKFDLRRTQCPSSDDTCCRYHIAVTAEFKELPAKDAAIVLAPNYARSNSMVWSLADDRANMPAHEFGHHLGNPDEYAGANIDKTLNDDGAVNGIDADSLMGQNMTKLKKRHFKYIGLQIAAMVDEATKRCNGFTYDALPAK
ncbi:MAG: hypothetical protein ACTHN5_01365 [Phycisphaerae bacterium]